MNNTQTLAEKLRAKTEDALARLSAEPEFDQGFLACVDELPSVFRRDLDNILNFMEASALNGMSVCPIQLPLFDDVYEDEHSDEGNRLCKKHLQTLVAMHCPGVQVINCQIVGKKLVFALRW